MVNNAEKYAEAVVKAVAEYKNIPYTAPGSSNTVGTALTYIVKSGDSLWSISKRYGLKVDDLKRANNLTSDFLKIGQKLIIPMTDSDNQNQTIYVVKSGDTLYSIASRNNISVSDLMSANNLKSNLLSINQQLIIPKSNNTSSTINYTVKSGDSLWKIARLYNTTVAIIKDLNNLTSDLLRVGQVLKLPV